MPKLFKKITDFIGHDVWAKDESDFSSNKERWLVKQARLILYTARGVQQHSTVVRSAALTFFSVMALVPILALAFGILKGFGMEVWIENYLFNRFSDNAGLVRYVLNFVNNVLERTSGGLVAASGFVLLIWAAVRVFGNVENAFNAIWEVKKPRSIGRRVSTYAAVIFIIPLFIVIIVFILTFVRSLLSNFSTIPFNIAYAIGLLVIFWLIFVGAYKIIPNTKVKFRNAAFAAVIATIAFAVFQFFYIFIQRGVSSYNIIYGSFAAIPLFLLWVHMSWQIVLFGAELSFSYQNVESFVQEQTASNVSYDNKRKVTMAVMLVIIRSFVHEDGGISSEDIAKKLKLPIRLIRDVCYTLEEADLIVPINTERGNKENVYVPAKDIHNMTFYDTLASVEALGTSVNTMSHNRDLRKVSRLLEEIK